MEATELWLFGGEAGYVLRRRHSLGVLADETRLAESDTQTIAITPVGPSLVSLGGTRYAKLSGNLFAPDNLPTLPQNLIDEAVAAHTDRVGWLVPTERGVTVHSVPLLVFHSITEPVRRPSREPAQPWRPSQSPFILLPFRSEKEPTEAPEPKAKDVVMADVPMKVRKVKKIEAKPITVPALVIKAAPVGDRALLEAHVAALEERFRAVGGPLDGDERMELWAQLSQANESLGRTAEAAQGWLNLLWERRDHQTAVAWANCEKCSPSELSPAGMRAFAANMVANGPNDLVADTAHLEKNEKLLGIRPAWLAWQSVVGNDILALARARDRLLERMMSEGGNPEFDLPHFLRYGGNDARRTGAIRAGASRIHKAIEKWHEPDEVRVSRPYVDLIVAFGMARLGEDTTAKALLAKAGKILDNDKDLAHRWLYQAFAYRIGEALANKPHGGPFPDKLNVLLANIDEGRGNGPKRKYIVDRLRSQSWILEPEEHVDPYDMRHKYGDELNKKLEEIIHQEPEALRKGIAKLVESGLNDSQMIVVLSQAMTMAIRGGEPFAIDLVTRATKVAGGEADGKLVMIERGLSIAAHYDRPDLVQALFGKFLSLLESLPEDKRHAAIGQVARQAMRGLRKFGMTDQIGEFLNTLKNMVLGKKAPATVLVGHPETAGSLLSVADGWLHLGQTEKATPILDAVRDAIVSKEKIRPLELAKMAEAYLMVVAHTQPTEALARMEDVFNKIDKLPNGFTTASHFSRLHTLVTEAAVRAMTSDQLVIGDDARRWRDENEYLIRRRIHADMRAALAANHL